MSYTITTPEHYVATITRLRLELARAAQDYHTLSITQMLNNSTVSSPHRGAGFRSCPALICKDRTGVWKGTGHPLVEPDNHNEFALKNWKKKNGYR